MLATTPKTCQAVCATSTGINLQPALPDNMVMIRSGAYHSVYIELGRADSTSPKASPASLPSESLESDSFQESSPVANAFVGSLDEGLAHLDQSIIAFEDAQRETSPLCPRSSLPPCASRFPSPPSGTMTSTAAGRRFGKPQRTSAAGELLTANDVSRVEKQEQVNDACIKAYVDALVHPTIQCQEKDAMEYWHRRLWARTSLNGGECHPAFHDIDPENPHAVDLTWTHRPETAALTTMGGGHIDLTRDGGPALEWATTISHLKNHWALIVARFSAESGCRRAEILVCDSIQNSITWHKSALLNFAARVGQELTQRLARPNADATNGALSSGKTPTGDAPPPVDMTIHCRIAKASPQQEDSINCGPLACMLLASFTQNQAHVGATVRGRSAVPPQR